MTFLKLPGSSKTAAQRIFFFLSASDSFPGQGKCEGISSWGHKMIPAVYVKSQNPERKKKGESG